MIIIDHISHIYDKDTAMARVALKDISLTIPQGQFVGLIGQTGSGKSTLIQHLNALLKPTSGSIYYHGADIFDADFDRKALRSKIGLVFQYPEHQLFGETVFSDVCFGPQNMGLAKLEVELRSYNALRSVGISERHFFESPLDLSGGEMRRVAIAGVLAMQPEVLILDEPTAGLDPAGRNDILGQISTLQKTTGMTVVLVSHSMEDVAKYVTRLCVMNQGQVVIDGSPEEVFVNFPILEDIGLAAPQMVYVMAALRKQGFDVPPVALTVPEALDNILRILPC